MAQTKITGDMIADDAVTTALIADDAVTADHLANSINSAITANTAKVTNAITTHTGDVTGGAALTIAVDAVDIPMLSATGSPSNTTFLRGDNAWAAVPAGVDIQSSAPSVASEGSLYYNTTTDKLNLSNGTAWLPLDTNAPPTATGGTVTIAAQSGLSTFSYNLGLNFTDEDVDENLSYTLESGTLPAGAVLPTPGNKAFTGTATNQATATYNFVIRATDAKAAFITQAYTQTINITPVITGGTVTTISGYKVHTFNSSGTFATNSPLAVQYLVIAGGAGGGQGYQAGGGGAGGYRSNVTGQVSGGGASAESTLTLSAGNTTVTVGAGGAGGPASTATTTAGGGQGANSVMGSITSLGGGGGASYWTLPDRAGFAGGSGGGGGNYSGVQVGGAGTTGQGYAGGGTANYLSPNSGGGGGGASAVGVTGSGGVIGNGGAGASSNINGTATTRAGGGGGAPWVGSVAGAGGAGGGGAGSVGNVSTVGTAGTANTGGGGGGSSNQNVAGGAGGSGIVIIRYAV
jgi:hypothetical protein